MLFRSRPAVLSATPPTAWAPRIAGALMTAGALFALQDFYRVVLIYQPGNATTSLAQRIRDGQHSVFFSYQADYALATTTEPPAQALGAFETATHALLDTRLMMAWARALDGSGHPSEARTLAQRLREFRNPDAAEFLAECDAVRPAGAPAPFQCTPAVQEIGRAHV